MHKLNFQQNMGVSPILKKQRMGDFVILGWGAPDIQGEIIYAYLIKVNSLGEAIWEKTYYPPELSYELNAYDLEPTSDGGFAFVGNYRADGDWTFKTWVVKTDACGFDRCGMRANH
ncbi:MAG: hypothetical protein U5L01_07470 [Rheinheimera sp.]|nr:hypothetical protein [Rheinheimera sp.]